MKGNHAVEGRGGVRVRGRGRGGGRGSPFRGGVYIAHVKKDA